MAGGDNALGASEPLSEDMQHALKAKDLLERFKVACDKDHHIVVEDALVTFLVCLVDEFTPLTGRDERLTGIINKLNTGVALKSFKMTEN